MIKVFALTSSLRSSDLTENDCLFGSLVTQTRIQKFLVYPNCHYTSLLRTSLYSQQSILNWTALKCMSIYILSVPICPAIKTFDIDIFHCIVYSLFTPQPAAVYQGEKRLCRNLAHWSGLLLGEMWWLELVLARSGALLVTTIIPSSPPAAGPALTRREHTLPRYQLSWGRYKHLTSSDVLSLKSSWSLVVTSFISWSSLLITSSWTYLFTRSVKKMDILNNLFSIKNTH